jgi:hypothetical protein
VSERGRTHWLILRVGSSRSRRFVDETRDFRRVRHDDQVTGFDLLRFRFYALCVKTVQIWMNRLIVQRISVAAEASTPSTTFSAIRDEALNRQDRATSVPAICAAV